jgi:hypothetical protein
MITLVHCRCHRTEWVKSLIQDRRLLGGGGDPGAGTAYRINCGVTCALVAVPSPKVEEAKRATTGWAGRSG